MPNSTYQLPIEETIRTSWDKVKGSKGSFWAAIGISILIAIGFGFLEGIFGTISTLVGSLVNLIGQVISTLISMGILYMGIQRAKNGAIKYKQMFYAFETAVALKIIGVYLIQFLIFLPLSLLFILLPMLVFGTAIGDALSSGFSLPNFLLASWLLLGILIAIYLTIRMILSMGFVLDKNMGPWDAIKTSFTVTKNNELALLGILVFQMLAIIIGAIPLGIGLIWTLPFVFIIYGMTYKNMLAKINR